MKIINLPKGARRTLKTAKSGMSGAMIRRTTNRNAHIITHHGNVRVGRKGRTG